MTDNYRMDDLLHSLREECTLARYYPLIPVKDELRLFLRENGVVFRDDVSQNVLTRLSERFGEENGRLFARFLHLYDFDRNKLKEIREYEGTDKHAALENLLRLPGVRRKRAELYFLSGVTLSVLANSETETIRTMVAQTVAREQLSESVPLPKEVNTHREVAKMLLNTRSIKEEANAILRGSPLLAMLGAIGVPHIIGSYRMDMMVSRDIDIDIENDAMSLEKLHTLTAKILIAFHPTWYEAKEVVTDEGTTKWFHGFESVIDGKLWNFDLWFQDRQTIAQAEAYCDDIAKEASPAQKEAILCLKRELIERGLYAFDKYTGMDVYDAVLRKGIYDTEAFLKAVTIR